MIRWDDLEFELEDELDYEFEDELEYERWGALGQEPGWPGSSCDQECPYVHGRSMFQPNAGTTQMTRRNIGAGTANGEWEADVRKDPGKREYDELVRQIIRELRLPFTDPSDPGLHRRRLRLRALFGRTPVSRRRELLSRLGDRPTGDDLSRLFHGRLHTATRRELLDILRRSLPAAQPPPRPAPAPAFISWHEPLPASAQARYDAAVRSLTLKINTSLDPRAWRYHCWLAKLARGADDRLIPWAVICPPEGVRPPTSAPCEFRRAVDQAALQSAIRSVSDVDAANKRLSFMIHLRPQILSNFELLSDKFHLEALRDVHDQVQLTVDRLGEWANVAFGGSSSMPRAYRAIKDWIGQRQSDPNSLYSCI